MVRRPLLATLATAALLLPAAPAGAIVGGQPATEQWPAVAAIFLNGSFNCTATLVRDQWVLTAAHCLADTTVDQQRVVLGRQDIRSVPASARLVVSEMTFDSRLDIGLLKLAQPVTATPLTIVAAGDAPSWAPGNQLRIMGYGQTSEAGGGGDILRQTDVPIRADNECALAGIVVGYDNGVDFCAGETLGGEDTCYGDSGGPALVRNGAAWVLAGVTSRGTGCALPTQYGIYARLGGSVAQAWLKSKLPEVSTPPPGGTLPPPSGEPPKVTVELGRSAGRARRLRVKVAPSAALTDVKLTLKGRGRTVARGARASLSATRTLALKRNRKIRPGSYTLTVRARDSQNRLVMASRLVKVRR